MDAAIRDVVENHRREVGAVSVHVTLGDNATADRLAKSLAEARRQTRLYDAFREEEKRRAEVRRLRKLLQRIWALARLGDNAAIASAAGLVPDVALVDDLHEMAAHRARIGEALPEGLQDWLDAHPLKG